ncbi:hypothetical protein U1Q18_049172, partial [Sarracenia purpurea var. burkii]
TRERGEKQKHTDSARLTKRGGPLLVSRTLRHLGSGLLIVADDFRPYKMAAEVPLGRPAETTDFSGKNHAASPTDTFRRDRRAWCDSADFVPRGQILTRVLSAESTKASSHFVPL